MYRAHTELEGFAIRKSRWNKLKSEFSYFIECLTINFRNFYNWNLLKPLFKKKI